MQRTQAAKWFWPTMLVAAVVAVAMIGLSAFVQSKAMSSEPDFRLIVAVRAQMPHVVERTPVTIEPSRIDVVGTRSTSVLDRVVARLPQRKRAI